MEQSGTLKSVPDPPAPQWRRAWWRVAPLTVLIVVLGKTVGILLAILGLSDNWFGLLKLPFAIPPAWLFAVEWLAGGLILGSAWAMVISVKPGSARLWGLASLYAAMVADALWPAVFFLFHDIAMTKVMVSAATMFLLLANGIFFSVRRLAGWLLIPYLLWLAFVTAMVIGIDRLNPAAGESIFQTTESKIDAIRKETRGRLREGDDWLGRDDRRDGPGGRRDDPRQDPRMDGRRERGNQP